MRPVRFPPPGSLAVICVAESTVKDIAGVPLKRTAVVPVKLVPVIVTTVPESPLVGVKPVIAAGDALVTTMA